MITRHKSFILLLLIGVILSLFVVIKVNANFHSGRKLLKPTPDLPKAVKIFNAVFKREVKCSDNLTRLFDISNQIAPSEFYAGKIYLTTALGADIGNENAAVDAMLLARNIPSDGKKISADVLVAVYSNSVAKSLYKLGALDGRNSRKLAKSYATMMEISYRNIAMENYPRSKVAASTIGFSTFVGSQFETTELVEDAFTKAYSNEWRLQARLGNIPDADVQLPPLRNTHKNPLLQSDLRSCFVSIAVRQFCQFFHHAVKSSKTLSDLHELDPSVKFSKGAEYTNLYQLQKFDVPDAAILADFMSKHVDDKTARNHLVEFCAVFIGKYLESELILNVNNAGSLASTYAKFLEHKAESIVNEKNPRSKITAMSYGMFEYLRELRAFDVSRGKKLAFFYGNEWKCLECKK